MTTCPACGAELATGLRPWHRPCTGCIYEGSVLTGDILGQEDGGDLDEPVRSVAIETLRRENFLRLAAMLRAKGFDARATGQRPTLLDVGCAHGWFLEAVAADFDATGIEPDPHVTGSEAVARRVRHGFFPDVLEASERFDVIAFNDVLEHLSSLENVLSACHRHLADNGLLVVNAPARSGALYRISKAMAAIGAHGPFDRMWQAGFPSPHVHYFDTPSLDAIGRRNGFALESVDTLPAMSRSGLYSRLRYARQGSAIGAAAMATALTLAMPVLAVLPPDIRVWFLRKA